MATYENVYSVILEIKCRFFRLYFLCFVNAYRKYLLHFPFFRILINNTVQDRKRGKNEFQQRKSKNYQLIKYII